MRLNVWRVVAFFLLIVLSVGFGFAFDAAATAMERHNHPRPTEFAEAIKQNAEDYGIPEAILWATANTGSGFASNAVSSDGRVGLMQLTPAQFSFISEELLGKETPDAGLLYDPETNLQCGAAWLSYLYERYDIWELVYVAYHTGTETVDTWLSDPEYTDNGVLTEIPDKEAAQYAETMQKAVETYRKLYYKT